MKAGAIGRLGNVTKLLQRQRRDSQWRMQYSVKGEPSLSFPRSPQGRRFGGITPGKFLKSASSQSPSKTGEGRGKGEWRREGKRGKLGHSALVVGGIDAPGAKAQAEDGDKFAADIPNRMLHRISESSHESPMPDGSVIAGM